MDERLKRALAITGVACIAYGVGYLHGYGRTVQALGEAATREAIFYLAARDIGKRMFGH